MSGSDIPADKILRTHKGIGCIILLIREAPNHIRIIAKPRLDEARTLYEREYKRRSEFLEEDLEKLVPVWIGEAQSVVTRKLEAPET